MSTPHDIPSHAHVGPHDIATMTRPDTQSHDAAVHHTASDRPAEPTLSQGENQDGSTGPTAGTEYPEQLHAGKVGYGPNYHQGPGFTDKVTGLKEEIKGKVTRKPELVQRGHDRITGELKKKELEEDFKSDPFANPEEKQEKHQQEKEGGETNGLEKHYTQPVQPKAAA